MRCGAVRCVEASRSKQQRWHFIAGGPVSLWLMARMRVYVCFGWLGVLCVAGRGIAQQHMLGEALGDIYGELLEMVRRRGRGGRQQEFFLV